MAMVSRAPRGARRGRRPVGLAPGARPGRLRARDIGAASVRRASGARKRAPGEAEPFVDRAGRGW